MKQWQENVLLYGGLLVGAGIVAAVVWGVLYLVAHTYGLFLQWVLNSFPEAVIYTSFAGLLVLLITAVTLLATLVMGVVAAKNVSKRK